MELARGTRKKQRPTTSNRGSGATAAGRPKPVFSKAKVVRRPSINAKLVLDLEYKAYQLRRDLIELTGKIGGAHIGGSFSQQDLLVALYYWYLNIDPTNPKMPGRDIFILSKGHASVGLCTTLADRGFFQKEELLHFNQTGSYFG
ncbi:MAG: hypothetical protein AAB425_14580, partial [Bdellovibrionota bacterium]